MCDASIGIMDKKIVENDLRKDETEIFKLEDATEEIYTGYHVWMHLNVFYYWVQPVVKSALKRLQRKNFYTEFCSGF